MRTRAIIAGSADFQSAVSPTCSRPGLLARLGLPNSRARQIENLRCGRLQICATDTASTRASV